MSRKEDKRKKSREQNVKFIKSYSKDKKESENNIYKVYELILNEFNINFD